MFSLPTAALNTTNQGKIRMATEMTDVKSVSIERKSYKWQTSKSIHGKEIRMNRETKSSLINVNDIQTECTRSEHGNVHNAANYNCQY